MSMIDCSQRRDDTFLIRSDYAKFTSGVFDYKTGLKNSLIVA